MTRVHRNNKSTFSLLNTAYDGFGDHMHFRLVGSRLQFNDVPVSRGQLRKALDWLEAADHAMMLDEFRRKHKP